MSVRVRTSALRRTILRDLSAARRVHIQLVVDLLNAVEARNCDLGELLVVIALDPAAQD